MADEDAAVDPLDPLDPGRWTAEEVTALRAAVTHNGGGPTNPHQAAIWLAERRDPCWWKQEFAETGSRDDNHAVERFLAGGDEQ